MKALVALDLNQDTEASLAQAIAWAVRLGATLDLMTSIEERWVPTGTAEEVFDPAADDHWDLLIAVSERRLAACLEQVPAPMRGEALVTTGRASARLIERTADYDLLILSTHGRRGIERLFIGSVAEQVLRGAKCPVLVSRFDGAPIPLDAPLVVVVPIDARRPDRRPLQWLLPRLDNCVPKVLHVLPPQPLFAAYDSPIAAARAEQHERVWAEAQVLALCEDAGLKDTEVQLNRRDANANAGNDIARYAEGQNAHLVAVAAHSHRDLGHLIFGSVAERVSRVAPCAVLVVPPE